jgi:Tol biopolymer transport system component
MTSSQRLSVSLRLVLVGVATLAGWSLPARAAPGDTELVSVAPDGTAAGRSAPYEHSVAVSAGGRYVAFVSIASNLVPSDTNNAFDVFVRDRLNGTIERVSVSSGGGQADGPSDYVDISGDGRYVVFHSTASNLVANDTNGKPDIFLHDRQNGATRRVSVSSTGAQGNAASMNPTISRNGEVIAFTSSASTLVPSDANNEADIFVYRIDTGALELASLSSSGRQGHAGNLAHADSASLSSDGRYVAFSSGAPTLVPDDTNGSQDVFVRDRLNHVTERVSVNSNGVQSDGFSNGRPSISGDGRYVAFNSDASNLAEGSNPGSSWGWDIFVHDRATGKTELVSVGLSGTPTTSEGNFDPDISADGRYVVFNGGAPDLVSGDTNGLHDFFWRDRVEGRTERVSVATNGGQANGNSWSGAVTADGLLVAFVSDAGNLTAGDSNTTADVFVHEPGGPTTGPQTFKWSLLPKYTSFGVQTVDTSRRRGFTIENLGNAPLPISVSLFGRDASSFTLQNNCGATVPVAQKCVVNVFFRPMIVGDKVATLRVTGPNDVVRDRKLTGTAVPGAFTLTPTSIAFGGIAVGSVSEVRIVTITNTGRASLPLGLLPAQLAGDRPGQFTRHDNCYKSLSPGGSCTVAVRFVPEYKGPLSAELVVTAGGLTSPKSVALTGRGL